jgi:hypothetical protein
MFKYLRIHSIILTIFFSNISFASPENSELKLSEKTVEAFYDYISSKRRPLDKFLVTLDGNGVFVWVCPQTLCFPGGERYYLKPCSKVNGNKKCKIFAMGRKIKLSQPTEGSKNLILFTQEDTFKETRKKLKKLGFVD